jgi:hypothetical protein
VTLYVAAATVGVLLRHDTRPPGKVRIAVGLAAIAVVVVVVLLVSLGGGDDREIERGAPGFPVAGSLADDNKLIEKAADAWVDDKDDHKLEGTIQVLWAGPWQGRRMVVLRNEQTVASIMFSSHDSDGRMGNESLAGPDVVRVNGGFLVKSDAPTRYTAAFKASDGEVETKHVVAHDRLIAETGRPMALLADDAIHDQVPLILAPASGNPVQVLVEAAHLPAMRRALLGSRHGIVTMAALDFARRNGNDTFVRLARVLHVGPVPGGGTGVAVVLDDGAHPAIGFAWEQNDSVSGEQLGVADAGPSQPSLAARTVSSSSGPWLVVAGDAGVARIVIESGRRVIRRDEPFALLRVADDQPFTVRGYTAEGKVVPAAGQR